MGDSLSRNLDSDRLLPQLTIDEKIGLLSGSDFWHTARIPRLKIPSIRLSDGPNGIRGTKFFNSVPAACLPCGTALGATWSTEIACRAGHLLARECRAKGVHAWLGPTMNIQRAPLGGRGFESFSEDPLLSGHLAAGMINAIQQHGIASFPKHFVGNDMEHERTRVNCVISDRALREIYLHPFQIAIREAQPWGLMTAYNKVNGCHMSENAQLIGALLRDEWKWEGVVTSDWYGTYSTSKAINAGLDLEMPGPSEWRGALLNRAVSCGKVMESTVDRSAARLLRLMDLTSQSAIPESAPESTLDTRDTIELLKEVSVESIVLLKNENELLPLNPSRSVAVIGPNAREARYCGGGSAALRPYRAVSILDAIRSMGLDVRYAPGCQSFHQLPVLGDNVRTREGKVGSFHFRVYKQPLDRSEQPLEEFELDDSNIVLFDYKNHEIHNDILYAQLDALLCIDETGEYEFGLTVSGKAKLYIDGDLVVDNSVNQVGGESFFGSGTIEGRARKLLDPSRSYTLRVDFSSAPTSELQASGSPTFGPGGLRLGCARIITEDEEIARATQVARDADQVVLCCGLNGDWESEGSDRLSMDLPSAQIRLISEVCAANPRTVVVNQSGCPVGGPWDDVPAFIQAWYGGNQTGDALADVLFGKASPSGKLPLSWPRQTSDNPSYLNHRSDEGRCIYGEDIFVGYRYYEKVNRAVQWPFGFGLSFVKLELSNLSARHEHDHASNGLYTKIHVSVDVTNSSALVCGAEVVQLYVQAPATSRVSRAVKELKGFAKVKVMPNETKKVTVTITSKHAFSFWSEKCNRWVMEKGAYQLLVGSSSSYTPLTESVHVYETLEWEGL